MIEVRCQRVCVCVCVFACACVWGRGVVDECIPFAGYTINY